VGTPGAEVLTRRLILLGALAAASLALAACGGGGSSTTDAPDGGSAVLASAAQATRDAGSSKVAFTLTSELPTEVSAEPVTFTGEGEFDYANRTGTVSYDFSDLLASFGQTSSEPVEIRFLGDVFYMRFPLISQFLPGAKEWIEFDVNSLGAESGIDLSQLQQLGQSDPSQALDYLRATGSVEEVGSEQIDGFETTHYAGTIQLDAVVEQVPADQREAVRKAIDQLKEQTGLTEIPVDVWVDGDGLVRKMSFTYTAKVPVGDETQDASSTVTMEFSDYGVDVNVEAPPADEVTNLAELSGLSGGSTS
jgi:hypothetical protein